MNKLKPQLNFCLHAIIKNLQGKISKLHGKYCINTKIIFQVIFFEKQNMGKIDARDLQSLARGIENV